MKPRVLEASIRNEQRSTRVVSCTILPGRLIVYSGTEALTGLREALSKLGLKTSVIRQSICG